MAAEAAEVKPKPKIVSVGTEMVPDRYIQFLLKSPMQRPSVKPEGFYERYPRLREVHRVTDAHINKVVDVQQYILKQYHAKGYATVGVQRYDNGRKRPIILPDDQEETDAAA